MILVNTNCSSVIEFAEFAEFAEFLQLAKTRLAFEEGDWFWLIEDTASQTKLNVTSSFGLHLEDQ